MTNIKYHYAFNEINKIVDIDEVSSDYRATHQFHCISCGAEMIAKLGSKNTHHFAHKADTEHCGLETYLHKLGKYLLKKKFEESPTFYIEFKQERDCKKQETCILTNERCYTNNYERYDLKTFYDTCEEEKTIDGFRADLLLTDSKNPSFQPTMIEICVTHESTQEKMTSGHLILEIKINSEEDLMKVATLEALRESPKNIVIEKKRGKKNQDYCITIAGVNRRLTTLMNSKQIYRFAVFPNSSSCVTLIGCNEIGKYDRSVIELNIHKGIERLNEEDVYRYGLLYVAHMGYRVVNCKLCDYCSRSTHSSLGSSFDCSCSPLGMPPRIGPQTRAWICRFYRVHPFFIQLLERELPNINISVVKQPTNKQDVAPSQEADKGSEK